MQRRKLAPLWLRRWRSYGFMICGSFLHLSRRKVKRYWYVCNLTMQNHISTACFEVQTYWYKGDFNYLSFTCTSNHCRMCWNHLHNGLLVFLILSGSQKGPCIRAGHEEQGAARDMARSRRTGWVKRSHWKTSLRNLDCWKILSSAILNRDFSLSSTRMPFACAYAFWICLLLYIIHKGMIGYLWGCVRCSCRPIVVLFMLHTQRHTTKGRILLVIQTIQEEHDMVKCGFEIPVQFYWHWKW